MAMHISVAAMKGGVGKTLTVLNLVGTIRKSFPNSKILVVDTDAQGNATKGFRVKLDKDAVTIYDVFMETATVREAIVPTYDDHIDVLPANVDNSYLEFDKMVRFKENILEWFVRLLKKYKDNLTKLMSVSSLKKLMTKSIDPTANYFNALDGKFDDISDDYDFVIFDTPPELKQVTSSVLSITDVVLIPFEPDLNSVDGVTHLISRVITLKDKYNPNLRIGGIVANKVTNTNVHAKMINSMMKYANRNRYHYFDTEIPRSIQFADKLIRNGMPITMSAPNNDFAQKFYKFFNEVNELGLLSKDGKVLKVEKQMYLGKEGED
jgi:chromosome partitioning protein